MKKIIDGNFNLDEIAPAQREFEGQIRLINAIISAYGIASKNKRALVGLKQMKLMDLENPLDITGQR